MRKSGLIAIRRRASQGAVAFAALASFMAVGCSSARDRAADEAEEQLEEQIDPSGERDLDVQIDPDSSIVRVDDPESGAVIVTGAGQDRPDFLDESIPLPGELEISFSSVQEGITKVEGELPEEAVEAAHQTYAAAAEQEGWAVETDPQSLLGEEVVLLAYLTDGAPLDVRLDGSTFTLYVGRFWERPPGSEPSTTS